MSHAIKATNKYQLAGVDDRERGFSRQADVRCVSGLYCAVLTYEALRLEVEGYATETAALSSLVRQLQERGYTQLQTRLHFQGDRYLGSQEFWVEYPDPEPEKSFWSAIVIWIRRLFGKE